MEKIRVNMTPCEEVKTIHASQNDNATRKWAFDLYDENGKIDSSDIKEQMIFDSRVGGTEQILPENGSDPTTSPIIADIQYPDSLRSEQTFLYRESPTQQDGQAKITHIKGNTVVFNQLIPSTASSNTVNGVTFTNNGDGSFTVNGTASANAGFVILANTSCSPNTVFYLKGCPSGGSANDYSILYTYLEDGRWRNETYEVGNGLLITNPYNEFNVQILVRSGKTVNNLKFVPQLFNLSIMGLGSLTLNEVKEWFATYFPLSYYAQTLGKLLPFKGESLKTTNADETETNVLSLPTLTYFPSGMKSAGSVYDELTENKAITRIGSRAYQSGDESDTSVITDGTTTYYALATPTEESITTSSLVTEKGESPLYYDDELIADCNETISSESGIFDAKIKLMDDETVYSQKIQLHVERKP